jgi:hypothetical protein
MRDTAPHAAGCVIFNATPDGPRILLIFDQYGQWTFPKGHLEAGETSAAAAIREVYEETGIQGELGAARLNDIQGIKSYIGDGVTVSNGVAIEYDADGNIVKWGPIASGRTKCSDSNKACLTMTGVFRVFSKENEKCKSDVFPIGKGGAKMPYCMYFHKGFAMHGSDDMPGYRASHGCVRMFTRDAKWLNETFVDVTNEAKNQPGTKVVVRPVSLSEKKS